MWALANPANGSSVNPIPTQREGADYAHHISASPPGFENPAAALLMDLISKFYVDSKNVSKTFLHRHYPLSKKTHTKKHVVLKYIFTLKN